MVGIVLWVVIYLLSAFYLLSCFIVGGCGRIHLKREKCTFIEVREKKTLFPRVQQQVAIANVHSANMKVTG